MPAEQTSADTTEQVIADISRQVDDALNKLRPAYLRNRSFAFWHDVGLTGLGALATVLAGTQGLVPDGLGLIILKILVILLTALVTVFAACNQFFKFKSRADACHLALRNVHDVKNELELFRDDQASIKTPMHEWTAAMRRAVQKAVKDADLPTEEGSIWSLGLMRPNL
jgi:hypothetical protein